MIYSGANKSGRSGVGFYLSKNVEKNALLSYNPVNKRIMSIHISAKLVNITIIHVYVATSAADDSEIEFYALQHCIASIWNGDMGYIIGDFNAKVGPSKDYNEKRFVGDFGLGEWKERSEQLVELIFQNCL